MQNKTTLTFTGDIGFDKYMDKKWQDPDLVSDEILEYLKDTDHLVINVEGPLMAQPESTGEQATGAKALIHSMDPEAANFFDKLGADVWNICNNHIMDAGPDGIKSTLLEAQKRNVQTIGAGMNISEACTPIIFPEAGGIGMIAVGYSRACRIAGEDTPGCLNWSEMELVKEAIKKVKKQCRWCIVIAHDGEEFTALPSPYTRNRFLKYLDFGADIVVAHHPHVPMNYETVDGKVIFYSLGNFIFDTDYQRSQFNTEFGLFVKLHFTKDLFWFDSFGIKIDRETDHIIAHDLSPIFADVQADEYEKLSPLAAKMFVENTKRQLRYMKPTQFLNATEQDFYDNFYEPLRSGRVPGEVLDMQIMYPLSLQAEDGKWKESQLESVKKFMHDQL